MSNKNGLTNIDMIPEKDHVFLKLQDKLEPMHFLDMSNKSDRDLYAEYRVRVGIARKSK